MSIAPHQERSQEVTGPYVALSANGDANVQLARQYERSFTNRRMGVQWTLSPDLSIVASGVFASSWLQKELSDPQEFHRRLEVIQGAAALVVINAVKESVDIVGSPGYNGGWIRRRGAWTPGQESQLDMAMALGAGVPVFMPEGLPSLLKEDQEGSPMAHRDRLRAMGVLATPHEAAYYGSPGEHVSFILGTLEQHPAAEVSK